MVMIYALCGVVQSKKKQAIALAIGPVVVDIAVADESCFAIDQTYKIFTYLHWNQEQGPALFGFQEERDRAIFLLVISCSGIGPRLGLAILADLGSWQFIQAVHKGDERILSKVNGIGIKKAEQIMMHLKHKISEFLVSGMNEVVESHIDWHTISDALRALNYSRGEISAAIAFVRDKNQGDAPSFDQILRQALSFLSKQQ
jgi:Holliday junction DNA helicase RuvA